MSTPDGIVVPQAHIPLSGAVRFDLDQRVHRFLRDHLVGGRPLLSTVMGIETIAGAVRHARPRARIESIRDIRVGPPYLLPTDAAGAVEVTMSFKVTSSGDVPMSGELTLYCELRSEVRGRWPGEVRITSAEPHFAAVVVLAKPLTAPLEPPRGERPPQLPKITVSGATVYGLYFHGPSFRVVERAGIDGMTAVARLSRGLPPIVEPARTSITAPLLIELCLQTAGLWDLAAGNAMTIPHSIERISRFSDVDSDAAARLFAVVEAGADESGPRFDARVVDEQGHVHLTVDGYRTTAFGHLYDVNAADRVRDELGAISRGRRASP